VTALDELRAGRPGDEFVALLGRTIRAVAVARNFPPPDDLTSWGDEAVARTISEFAADPQTPRRLLDLSMTCATGQALRARLQGTVRNFLADLGRRTPVGKLVVRINDVLANRDEFVRQSGRWCLAGGPAVPAEVDVGRLAGAIRPHEIVVPKWSHEARRGAPVADAQTVASLCKTMLETAGGALSTRALAAAIAVRLDLGHAPTSLEAASLDPAWNQTGVGADATADAALRETRAVEVFTLLNDRERLALGWPEYTVRDLAPILGVGGSQAHIIRRRATEILKAELVDDPDAESVAGRILELARSWAEEWTGRGVPA
jgi:hypothetical protein